RHERYTHSSAVRELCAADTNSAEIVRTARGLEGLIRHAGVHACGIFLSSEPLMDVIPLWTRRSDGAAVTAWDYQDCEDVGLMKMDLLGSATLHAIEVTLESLRQRGVAIDLDSLALDDLEAYALLARGDTHGVFQFEEPGAAATLRRI